MSPSDAHSSLAALRQLKEMLDAGTITPAEFEMLKRQLIFGNEPPTSPVAPTPLAEAEVGPVASISNPAGYPEVSPAALTNPSLVVPDWLAAAAPGLPFDDESKLLPLAERRNPLNLVFIVGGLLVLVGIVLFLFIDRPKNPDEHLTSATQTAADSVVTVPEVGPQAEQLTLPPAAAPETIRVAPRVLPTVSARPLRTDSVVAAVPAATAPVSKAPVAPVTLPSKARAATNATPAPIDSTTTKAP